jgi:hypothetical protein
MKKNYSFKNEISTPKKATIDFLLNFSKSIFVIRTQNKNFIVSKN